MQDATFSEKLYTSTEVAQILGVSLRSIYRYLDEGKINAAVKTATGRHRFTKQNINDFLHPGKTASASEVKKPAKTEELEEEKEAKKEAKKEEHMAGEREQAEKEDKEETTVKEEPVDWLARFRQAAEKYRQTSDITSGEQNLTEEPVSEESTFCYYRSGVGGLKEIAQSLDKAAKNASLDYAFTMNAGLSLHKPIKPFSLIHAYIQPKDKSYFEKVLQLTTCPKDTSQLCFIVSNDVKVFRDRTEMHGLYVVSDQQLRSDLVNEGEADLAKELE